MILFYQKRHIKNMKYWKISAIMVKGQKNTKGAKLMIFKVLYQELGSEVPVRERTKALYVEAEAERDVRKKLANRNINIEFIHSISGKHLAYEQQSENFVLETL